MPGSVKECILKHEAAIAQQAKLQWVQFKLQDDKGAPMPNVTLRVKLPDGKFEEATSDATGLIYIKNLKPGTCSLDLSFTGQSVETTAFLQ